MKTLEGALYNNKIYGISEVYKDIFRSWVLYILDNEPPGKDILDTDAIGLKYIDFIKGKIKDILDIDILSLTNKLDKITEDIKKTNISTYDTEAAAIK